MSKDYTYDELIISYLEGNCASEDACVLLSWLAESEENRAYFESFKKVWEVTSFEMTEEMSVEDALASVNSQIDVLESQRTIQTAPIVRFSWLQRNYKYVSGVAAAIVIALIIGVFVKDPFDAKTVLASAEYVNGQSCFLPDGTEIVFDSQSESELSYGKSFGKSFRQVSFEGVAVFDVAKDAEKPFIIRSGNLQVEVLGTSFMLDASNASDIKCLDLYTGRVKMSSLDENGNEISSIEVMPGERGILRQDCEELQLVSAMDVKKERLQTKHELEFKDEPLRIIVETVEYIYGVRISLAKNQEERKITVRFTDDSIDEVLETVAYVANLELVKSESAYELR